MEIIKIEKKEWAECDKASQNYWANKKTGRFGKGIINSKDDPRKVERTGLLGEMALSKFLKIPANFDYVQGGEKKDFVLEDGRTVELKTASYDYGCSLVRCISAKGNSVMSREKMCDVYIAAYIKSEDRDEQTAEVALVGWMSGDDVSNLPPKPARQGNHQNWELDFKEMNDLNCLI